MKKRMDKLVGVLGLTVLTLGLLMTGCEKDTRKQDTGVQATSESSEAPGSEEVTASSDSSEPSEASSAEASTVESLPEGGDDAVDEEKLFAQLTDWEFFFMSGAGGWQTSLTVDEKGNFTGEYYDGDLGDIGDGYGNGTLYISNFTGKFTDAKRINDYCYEVKVADVKCEEEEGKEEIVDQMRYVYSRPYGIDGAEKMIIFLPGTPVDVLPEGYMDWILPTHFYSYVNGEFEKDIPEDLPFCGLYNAEAEEGFFSENGSYNRTYLVNKGSYPGLKNIASEIHEDGTYFWQEMDETGMHVVTNLCYKMPENTDIYMKTEEFVKDCVAYVMDGQEYSDLVYFDRSNEEYFGAARLLYVNGVYSIYASWNAGGNEDTRQYRARFLQNAGNIYAYVISCSQYDTDLCGEQGTFLLSSLTFSGLREKLDTKGSKKDVARKILAEVRSCSQSGKLDADEVIWVSWNNEELIKKYNLNPDEMMNDYAIVEDDGDYKTYSVDPSCSLYIQYSTEGVFHTKLTIDEFNAYMKDMEYGRLMELYLDDNDQVIFAYEPYTP